MKAINVYVDGDTCTDKIGRFIEELNASDLIAARMVGADEMFIVCGGECTLAWVKCRILSVFGLVSISYVK